MIRFLFLFFSIVVGISTLKAQSYSFPTYSVAEGLPQSQISAIIEDNVGFLWIGTYGGLAKFNGTSFQNFSTNDGLFNNRITSLNYHQQELWIGHEGGVSMYHNTEIKKWIFSKNNSNVAVSAIIPFLNHVVIATNGAGIYTINKNNILKNTAFVSNDQNRIRGMLVLNDQLYLATRNGLYVTSDLISFELIPATENFNISSITEEDEKLVILTFENEIFRYNPVTSKMVTSFTNLEYYGLRNLIIDQSKTIWIPSKEGIVHIAKNRTITYINEKSGLPLNNISVVFQDKNGTIWIGSEGKGLFRYPGNKFIYFDSKSSIQSDLIIAGYPIAKNNYLFGSYDKGLIHYQNGTFKNYPLNNSTIWAITKGKNDDYWLATSNGIIHIDQHFNKLKEYFTGEKITCFNVNKDGSIYAGGSYGIYKIVQQSIEFLNASNLSRSVGAIRSMTTYNNNLLCATDAGLFYFNSTSYIPFLNFTKKTQTFSIDKYNHLWIGTEEGLFWSDGKKIMPINLSKQTSSNFINFINTQGDDVFVGTNNGLYVLNYQGNPKKIKINHQGLEEGLINLESNINSSFIDQYKRLWFGTAQGLSYFYIPSLQKDKNSAVPHLSIKSIKLNFEDFNYKDYASSFNDEGIPTKLVLPRNKNNLFFELDGVDLNKSNDLQYQYYIEGFEYRWSPTFSNPLITLSNLPSGKYIVHIRAINKNKVFSNTYKLEVYITPAFYTTWWFFVLLSLLLTAIIIAIIQFRIKQERIKTYQEKLEYKARLSYLEQQTLNASMNRHFIFNSLNSIQYFINTQDKLSANRYLSSFAKLIRKNLDSSSEDNNIVSLMEELERLELYLSLEFMRFKDRFSYEIETNEIDTENILVPAMLLQPFVENSIIHGILPVEDRIGKIRINVEQREDYIIIVIEDNGVGIDNSIKGKVSSSGDHRSQGMEITSKRIELLKKISHKNFELEGPYQIEKSDRSISGTRVLIKIPHENLDLSN